MVRGEYGCTGRDTYKGIFIMITGRYVVAEMTCYDDYHFSLCASQEINTSRFINSYHEIEP